MTGPLGLENCTLWLDAAAETFADGDLVSTWTDRSGSGNHATISGAARPTFDLEGLNGLPSLRFDGDQYLNLPGGLFDIGSGTTFVVAQYREITSAIRYVLSSGQSDGSGRDVRLRWYFYAQNQMRLAVGPQGFSRDPTYIELFEPTDVGRVWALRSNGTDTFSRMKCGLSLDSGTEEERDTIPPAAGAAPGAARVGAFYADASQRMNGWIAEVVHFSVPLPDNDVAAVIEDLAKKWAATCGGWKVGRL